MKYVVFKQHSSNIEHVVVFSDTLIHKQVAERLRASEVVSAGFIFMDIERGVLQCLGYSESLNIGSRGETDSELIINQF